MIDNIVVKDKQIIIAFIHYCGLHQVMKSSVVDESLSSTQLQLCSRENQLATINLTEWEIYINNYTFYSAESNTGAVAWQPH